MDNVTVKYDYLDERGTLLFQVCRTASKRFFQRRPDGRGGWINRLGETRRVLYHLPELINADSELIVHLVEGEKDADRLIDHDLLATTNPGGAGKWRDEYSEHLKGREVVIIPDNDETGRRHAGQVAESLLKVGCVVRIVEPPNQRPKTDISDFLDNGGTIEQLGELVASAEPYTGYEPGPSAQSVQSVQSAQGRSALGDEQNEQKNSPIIWVKDLVRCPPEQQVSLWGPFIMRGSVALWSGIAGVGKSTLAYNVAISSVRGTSFGGLPCHEHPLKVLFVDLETPDALRANKIDNIAGEIFSDGLAFWDPSLRVTHHALEGCIQRGGFELVFIDTLACAFPVQSEDDNAQATAQMTEVKRIANNTGAAIVLIHHLGKTVEERGPYNSRGASARPAAADIVVEIVNHQKQTDVITLRLTKSRYVEPQTLNLKKNEEGETFEVVEGLDDHCASQIGKASTYLATELDAAGPKGRYLKDLVRSGRDRDHSESSIRRALAELVSSGRIKRPKRGWYVHSDHRPSVQSVHTLGDTPVEHIEQIEQNGREGLNGGAATRVNGGGRSRQEAERGTNRHGAATSGQEDESA